ncbi:MAG: alpha-2-macroglobulin family protein [Thermodesulfobacteriota bacterium]
MTRVKCYRQILMIIATLVLCGLFFPAFIHAADLTVTLRHDEFYPSEEEGLWAATVRFNHPVFPSDAGASIKVTRDGKDEGFELLDQTTSAKAKEAARGFVIRAEKKSTEPAKIVITVQKGLADSTGRQLLPRDYRYEFSSIEKIGVSDISTFYRSPTDKGLQLSLTREISTADLKQALTIRPAVPNTRIIKQYAYSFRVTGDFEFDKNYEVVISSIKVRDGRAILADRKYAFKGPGIAPKIEVSTKQSVIELRSRQLLPLTLSNVTKVKCDLKQIPPYLIPEFSAAAEAKGGLEKWPEAQRKEALEKLVKTGKVPAIFGKGFVTDSEVFFARSARQGVFGYSLPLSFRKTADHGGMWWTTLTDPDKVFTGSATKPLQITDLSITYKVSAKTLLVWVTSLYTGQPAAGVDVLLHQTDGYAFFVGKTDAQGLLVLKDGQQFSAVHVGKEAAGLTNRKLSVSAAKWAIAAKENDCAAVNIGQVRLKPFAVAQTEWVEPDPRSIKGYLFTERGIYQPGETVFFKGVVRGYEGGKIVTPTGKEVELEITDPRGDMQYTQKLALNDFGTCNASFEVKKFLPVGTYNLTGRIKTSDTKEVSFSRTFQVQEYKIPRHYVTLTAKKEERVSKEYVTLERPMEFLKVEAKASYYAGGPVKLARARWKATLVPVTNKVQGLDGFIFGNEDEQEQFLESGESVLDRTGKMDLTIPLDSRMLTGLYGVKIAVTVLDVDGEPATDVTTYKPTPRFLVGISAHPTKVQSGFAPTLKVIVVTPDGKKLPKGEIQASLMEKKYFYTQKRDETGQLNYLWEEGWVKSLSSRQSIVNGEATYELRLGDAGRYMVAFTYQDDRGTYTSQTMFQVGWEEYDRWIRARSKEERSLTSNEILLALTKKEYAVGEAVRVDFHAQRPLKKCLVTLEKGDILSYRVIDAPGKSGQYEFTTTAAFLPNVYVSVVATTARGDFPVYQTQTDMDIPSLFFGYADVRVRTDVKPLGVKISPQVSDLKSRPGEKVSLNFRVADDKGKGVLSELAVCVVDEAILALTAFRTPELSSLTDFDLPLSVFSGDLRLALITQDLFKILSTKPLTGGDEGLGEVVSTLRKRFDPVAYFNPALVTDASGQVSIEFTLPDTTTTYRVYAVVCDKGAGFASADRKMLVAKEFFVEPSLPRFVIPGDKVTFPVVVHNQTDSTGDATLQVQTSPNLSATLAQPKVMLEAKSSSTAPCTADVTGGQAAGILTFRGKFGAFADAIEKTMPVHSRYLPVNRVTVGHFVKDVHINAELPEVLKKFKPEEMNPGDLQARLNLTTNNWNKIAPGLKYLLQFPFGCIEQKSSGIIALAGMRDVVKQGLVPGITIEKVDKYLEPGISQLLSMQLSSGGFAYWPGNLEGSWWGSLYATIALTVAQQAGYEVPEAKLEAALKYIKENLLGERDRIRTRWRYEQWTRELAVYCLAVNGMISEPELSRFMEGYDSLKPQGKALLLLAAHHVGSLSEEVLQKRVAELDPQDDPECWNYYDSSYRAIAVCLLAAVETKAPTKKKDTWAGYLIKGLKPEGRWHSTADTGWCLLALGNYFAEQPPQSKKQIPCRIEYAREKPIEVVVGDVGADVELDPRKLLEHREIKLTSPDKDLLNYTLYLTYPDLVRDPADLGAGFTLNKRIENLNGKKEIRVGDVVRVSLHIEIPYGPKPRRYRDVEYLALVDPLPAGLVAINSELQTEGVLREGTERVDRDSWRDGFYDFTPSHLEMRADRVNVFKNKAWPGTYRFSYLARAVAEGDFWLRGSRVSLMYNPDVFGKTKPERITILPAEK